MNRTALKPKSTWKRFQRKPKQIRRKSQTTPAAFAFAKVKADSVSSWKKRVWKLCSEWNRRKDTDSEGYARCCTCGTLKYWKEADAGHFRPGRFNSILFYDKGIHLQCKPCNGRLRNAPVDNVDQAYENYMRKRYGQKEIDYIDYLKNASTTYGVNDLKLLCLDYERKLRTL